MSLHFSSSVSKIFTFEADKSGVVGTPPLSLGIQVFASLIGDPTHSENPRGGVWGVQPPSGFGVGWDGLGVGPGGWMGSSGSRGVSSVGGIFYVGYIT